MLGSASPRCLAPRPSISWGFGIVLALAALFLVMPQPADAQRGPERVRRALQITETRIEHAASLVRGPSPAEREMHIAQDFQRRARGALADREPRRAIDLTLEARRHAERSISLSQGLPDPHRVRAQLERTRELLERARGRVAESNVDRAHALLDSALEAQRRAEDAAGDGRQLAALRLSIAAREQGHAALRACGLEDPDDVSAAAERAIERTDRVIAEVTEQLGRRPGPHGRRELTRAREIQLRARQVHRMGRHEESLQHTHAARAHAERALRRPRPPEL